MEEGIVPPREPTEYMTRYCSCDSCPIVDGRLPLMLVYDMLREVNELNAPMLVGIVPVRENKL